MKRLLLGAAIVPLLGLTTLASAQDPKPPQTPPTAPPQVTKKELKKELPFCHKASDVIGADVKNAKGENLGKVEELVIEPGSGTIDYAVISFGGFLGMGEKLFAVPFSLLKAPEVREGDKMAHFTFDVDKAKLEKAPGFEKKNWPDISAPAWAMEIDTYYSTKRAHPASAEAGAPGDKKDPGAAIDANASTRLCKASDVLGKKVENPANDNLGDVKELVLDPRRSRVSYFVMKSGGFLGMGDKLFAIPWSVMRVHRMENKDKLVLDLPKEKFTKAPEYHDKDWTAMSDPEWVKEVYDYYGAKPYWTSP